MQRDYNNYHYSNIIIITSVRGAGCYPFGPLAACYLHKNFAISRFHILATNEIVLGPKSYLTFVVLQICT
jgi:hypothetical protein